MTDTAEYWNDIKNSFSKLHFTFIHLKEKICGHYHKYGTDHIGDVDCFACIKMFTKEERKLYKKIQKKREKNKRKRKNNRKRNLMIDK